VNITSTLNFTNIPDNLIKTIGCIDKIIKLAVLFTFEENKDKLP